MTPELLEKSTTTDGKPADPGLENASAPKPIKADGQHGAYWVLSEVERSKGFVRPVRKSYTHETCGTITTMGQAIAETYATDPSYYTSTFCVRCAKHLPLTEFTWPDGSIVGS